jgi:excinuclease ABC subunit A
LRYDACGNRCDGEIVAQGTPEDIVKVARSYTGKFLKPVLGRKDAGRKKKGQQAGGVNLVN